VLPRIYRHGPHFGEEPPISGRRGSGAVFFAHCTMRCAYCQNYPWSQQQAGTLYSEEALRELLAGLAAQGCHNINLVSPTPWLPALRAAAHSLRRGDKRLPLIYNTSGFETQETLDAYADLIDIVLTDLRYADDATAWEASETKSYVESARSTLAWAWRERGPLRLDAEGLAVRGTICRLLVLPGHAGEAVANLEWIASHIGTDLHVSVMSQYTPVFRAARLSGWNRRVTAEEYRLVTDAAERLGFANGWIQPPADEGAGDLLGCEMPAGAGAVGERKETL
jgi:putative pyruvate formate lyase activating enzyme